VGRNRRGRRWGDLHVPELADLPVEGDVRQFEFVADADLLDDLFQRSRPRWQSVV